MRRKLVVGNWKMHGSLAKSQSLIPSLAHNLQSLNSADFAICIPYPYLFQAQALLANSNVLWGAQNVSQFEEGAFTASIAASMIADFGCTFAIIGHSERRALSHESNQSAARRFVRTVNASITPIYCVGETLEERDTGFAKNIVKNQILAITHGLDEAVFAKAKAVNTVIAYEPVWAIGTGHTATPQQAQEMHAFIRELLAERDAEFAKTARIIYGGSLNPANAAALFTMPDIDGGLVGRCSLDATAFVEICKSALINEDGLIKTGQLSLRMLER